MTDDNPTPLPWKVAPLSNGGAEIVGPTTGVPIAHVRNDYTHDGAANAARIVEAVNGYAALQERLEAAENALRWTRRLADDRYDIMRALKARHQRIERLAIIRGRCVFCSHPEDPEDGTHTTTCPVIDPDSDPCPFVGDSGDRCGLQFEHGGSHDLGY